MNDVPTGLLFDDALARVQAIATERRLASERVT
jgi:hypothetical protein